MAKKIACKLQYEGCEVMLYVPYVPNDNVEMLTDRFWEMLEHECPLVFKQIDKEDHELYDLFVGRNKNRRIEPNVLCADIEDYSYMTFATI